MKEITLTINMLIGFIFEIIFFFLAGMMFAFGYPISSGIYLVIGLILAWYTGEKIQKKAVEKYKKENEQN